MRKDIRILILVIITGFSSVASPEMVVTNGRNVVSTKEKLNHKIDPVTPFFVGIGMIVLGMWLNHKNNI